MDPDPLGSNCMLQIVLITIAFAIDNAAFIAISVRNLDRMKAIIATIFAIVLAVSIRGFAAKELQDITNMYSIPIQLIGGILLLGIVILQIFHDRKESDAKTGIWGVIGVIFFGDLLMSVDHVVALAALADSTRTLIIGTLINIPILTVASLMANPVMKRYPATLDAAAAILVGTAVKLMLSDPIISYAYPSILAIIAGVLAFFILYIRRCSKSINKENIQVRRCEAGSLNELYSRI